MWLVRQPLNLVHVRELDIILRQREYLERALATISVVEFKSTFFEPQGKVSLHILDLACLISKSFRQCSLSGKD